MRMELPNLVRYLTIIITVSGLIIFGFGMYLPNPDASINYVSEFDQEYAQENNEENGLRIPFSDNQDKNLTAEDIHKTYSSEDFSNETMETFRSNIESGRTFSVSEGNVTQYIGRFILTFENGSQYVYEGSFDGLYPPRVALLRLISAIIGVMAYSSIRRTKNNIPDGLVESDETRWKYEFED